MTPMPRAFLHVAAAGPGRAVVGLRGRWTCRCGAHGERQSMVPASPVVRAAAGGRAGGGGVGMRRRRERSEVVRAGVWWRG